MQRNLKELLRNNGVTLKKAYGQNFLTDKELLSDIVKKAGVNKNSEVLEIGCGAGALTQELSLVAKTVVGYEIDKTLQPVLSQTLANRNNVEIIYSDILKEKVSNVEKKFKNGYILVANLPYYITTPIVTEFLEKSTKLSSMIIMVQEEVANRFCAKEGTSDYGAITVAINLRGEANIIKRVGREMFTPVPQVDSAVVKIDIDRNKFKDIDLDGVREVVRCAFQNRRKMLVNNLMGYFKLSRDKAEKVLSSVNIPLSVRGESLNSKQFIALSNALKNIKVGDKKLVVASANQNKLREIQQLLPQYEVIGYKSLGYEFEIEENGKTFYENAKIKAKAVLDATGFAVLADDSGLCVDALGGGPGIYSARYSKEGTDQKNLELVLKNLKGVKKEDRKAQFVCCMVMLFPDGKEVSYQGVTTGYITEKPLGDNGFGYDPIFISDDLGLCLGIASAEQKNSISHRSRALKGIIKQLKKI